MSEKMTFTHLNGSGEAYMVDVTAKQPTVREATAIGTVRCSSALRFVPATTVGAKESQAFRVAAIPATPLSAA